LLLIFSYQRWEDRGEDHSDDWCHLDVVVSKCDGASLSPRVFFFVMAIIAGMGALDLWQRRVSSAISIGNVALANLDG